MNATTVNEDPLKQESDKLWASRLRESGLAGRTYGDLDAREKGQLDDIAAEVEHHKAELRESGGNGDLIDLSVDGIPTKRADSAPARSAPEPPDLDAGQLRRAMEDDGLAFKPGYTQAGAGNAPSGPRTMPLRSSSDPVAAGLRELENRARMREQTRRDASFASLDSPVPVRESGDPAADLACAQAWIAADRSTVNATHSDGTLDLSVDGVRTIDDPGRMREADPSDLIDLTGGPGVPGVGVKRRPTSELLREAEAEGRGESAVLREADRPSPEEDNDPERVSTPTSVRIGADVGERVDCPDCDTGLLDDGKRCPTCRGVAFLVKRPGEPPRALSAAQGDPSDAGKKS
jgi:hypothetical protein